MQKLPHSIIELFTRHFFSEPSVYFSPGRINLIGEHVDYNDGFVLPAAIDKGIYVAITANNTGIINLYAADFNDISSLPINAIVKQEGWKNYAWSVVNEFLLLGKKIRGFDVVFGGNIPSGAGMSSSAAVEGGLALAINEIFSCGLNKMELALLCQRAEHNFPGVQCGIMDQYANMMGKRNHVIFLDCKNLTHQYLPLCLSGYKIILLHSNVQHTLAASEYNLRRRQCEEGLAIMATNRKIHSFRDVGQWENILSYQNLMEEKVFMRCLYVAQEIERTQQAAYLLQQNDLPAFGKLMYDTHVGLSQLYEVSCAELDFLVQMAQQNKNVIGARLMGGGFGGCTINIVRENAVNDFIEETSTAYQKKFSIIPNSHEVNTSDAAKRLYV